jgi:hypothetical protein
VAPSLWLRGPVVSLRLRAVPPPKIKSGCRSISLQNRMAAAELGRGAYGSRIASSCAQPRSRGRALTARGTAVYRNASPFRRCAAACLHQR